MKKLQNWHEGIISTIMGSSTRSILTADCFESDIILVKWGFTDKMNITPNENVEYPETLIFGVRDNEPIHVINRVRGNFNEFFLYKIEYRSPKLVEFSVFSRRPSTPTFKNKLIARTYALLDGENAVLGELEMEDTYWNNGIGEYLMDGILNEFKLKGIKVVKGVVRKDDEMNGQADFEFFNHFDFEVKTVRDNVLIFEIRI